MNAGTNTIPGAGISVPLDGGRDIESGNRATDTNCCGKLCGRVFVDWSQGVMSLLAVGGLTLMGTGYIIDDKSIIAAGVAALALGLLFGCFRISCLKPKWTDEQRIEEYRKENLKLRDQVRLFGANIDSLRRQKEALQEVLAAAKKSVEELSGMLDAKVKDLAKINAKLEETVADLKKLEELYAAYKKESLAVAAEFQKFHAASKTLKEGAAALGGEVNALSTHASGLVGEGDRLDGANKTFEEQNKHLIALVAKLTHDGQTIEGRFAEAKSSIAAIASHTEKLDEVDDKFQGGAAELGQVAARLSIVLHGFEGLLHDDDEPAAGPLPPPLPLAEPDGHPH